MTTPHASGLAHLDGQSRFEDSNVALLGSEIDHKLHQQSAQGEPAWDAPGLGKQAGLYAFRVEDFKLKLVGQGDLGTGDFREGDSYIVLKSVAPVKPDHLIHDIFYWLGAKTSQDEAGTAAYKAVELDELLGGAPIQHRETQGHETTSFLSLFRPHFLVLSGGHASGFHHVSPLTSESLKLDHPRLFQVAILEGGEVQGHARKRVRVLEVEAKVDSVKRGDVFILDLGNKLLQWNGRESHPLEKAKAAEVARAWEEGRGGKAELEVLDDESRDNAFFLALGLDQSQLPFDLSHHTTTTRHIPIASRPTSVHTLLGDGPPTSPLTLSLLTPSSLLLIATPSPAPLYVWVGSEVPAEQRRSAMVLAQRRVALLAGDSVSFATRGLVRVVQGAEGEEFARFIEG